MEESDVRRGPVESDIHRSPVETNTSTSHYRYIHHVMFPVTHVSPLSCLFIVSFKSNAFSLQRLW